MLALISRKLSRRKVVDGGGNQPFKYWGYLPGQTGSARAPQPRLRLAPKRVRSSLGRLGERLESGPAGSPGLWRQLTRTAKSPALTLYCGARQFARHSPTTGESASPDCPFTDRCAGRARRRVPFGLIQPTTIRAGHPPLHRLRPSHHCHSTAVARVPCIRASVANRGSRRQSHLQITQRAICQIARHPDRGAGDRPYRAGCWARKRSSCHPGDLIARCSRAPPGRRSGRARSRRGA